MNEYHDSKGQDTDKKYKDKLELFETCKNQFHLESFRQLQEFR